PNNTCSIPVHISVPITIDPVVQTVISPISNPITMAPGMVFLEGHAALSTLTRNLNQTRTGDQAAILTRVHLAENEAHDVIDLVLRSRSLELLDVVSIGPALLWHRMPLDPTPPFDTVHFAPGLVLPVHIRSFDPSAFDWQKLLIHERVPLRNPASELLDSIDHDSRQVINALTDISDVPLDQPAEYRRTSSDVRLQHH